MGEKILVIGESGSGKSTATKNLDPKSTFYINCIGKSLPYKGWKGKYKGSEGKVVGNLVATTDWEKIVKAMQYVSESMPEIKTIIIDDAQYIMSYEFMARAKERGFDKFTEIAQHMFQVLIAPDSLRDDLMVIFLGHCDDANGRTKMKTIGKMLDEKITIEGMFTVVLLCYSYKEGEGAMKYVFVTNSNGTNTCKSPDGMFELTIPNDLAQVVKQYYEYSN